MDDRPRPAGAEGPAESGDAGRGGGPADGEPPTLARLDRRFDASTRREAAEALGNPSSSMSADAGRIVEGLFEAALTDPDEAVRAAAIESLYFHGDGHVDRLARRIAERRGGDERLRGDAPRSGDADGAVATFARWVVHDRAAYRMVGATGLSAVGDEDVAPRLREAFDDGDARVRARAVRGYARVGGEAVEAVRPVVNARNDLVRGAAVDALVAMDTDDAVELLARAARRGNERLRLTVVRRLGELDRRDAAGVLIGSLRDPAESVRRAAAKSTAAVIADADAVPAGDVRDRLLDERPFETDGLLAVFWAVAAERTGDDRTGSPADAAAESGERVDAETKRYAAWLYCELLEAADPTAADRSTAVEWLIDALDHRDRLVADLAAAYLPRIASTDGTEERPPDEENRSALGVDVERKLRALASDETASEAARERARAVLRRFKRAVVEAAADRDVEYVYVRWPADYTESYNE
ncbi:phycocyanobilin lyase subunit [Halorubrum californiense DSM 19288]|uniref:Phycocyanobilin lyase subunit n=1 Tax=Halorubrum californiense DSM 19288 TaxID=1227465 RepID=M0E2R6_9EURY|nr:MULTISPECIES: HEAT repeat domain-containing protein [Halorubrum]ELZ41338.1 phycocyanobilin lyase subunit [Halorubrum californiense DSM 19288]TKX67506.1 HEAT repeat domain-containing protein [Halorubrum sp. GN11GM_10-3_MGM]